MEKTNFISNVMRSVAGGESSSDLALLLSPIGIIAIFAISFIFFFVFEISKKKRQEFLEDIGEKIENEKSESELGQDPRTKKSAATFNDNEKTKIKRLVIYFIIFIVVFFFFSSLN